MRSTGQLGQTRHGSDLEMSRSAPEGSNPSSLFLALFESRILKMELLHLYLDDYHSTRRVRPRVNDGHWFGALAG